MRQKKCSRMTILLETFLVSGMENGGVIEERGPSHPSFRKCVGIHLETHCRYVRMHQSFRQEREIGFKMEDPGRFFGTVPHDPFQRGIERRSAVDTKERNAPRTEGAGVSGDQFPV